MTAQVYNAIKLVAALITVVAMVIQQYIPDKSFIALPNENVDHSIYGQTNEDGTQSSRWINEANEHWHCLYKETHEYSCGFSLSFNPDYSKGVDLSSYSGFKLKLNYQGSADQIRIYMRNYNSVYDSGDPLFSAKFQSAVVRVSDLKEETYVSLKEFSVAEWWIRDYDIPREFAAPEMNNIITFGFDFLTPGNHQLMVERIEFVGNWMSEKLFFFLILSFWMAVVTAESIWHFVMVKRKGKSASKV